MARQLFWLSDEVVRLWDIERLDAQVRLSRRRRRLIQQAPAAGGRRRGTLSAAPGRAQVSRPMQFRRLVVRFRLNLTAAGRWPTGDFRPCRMRMRTKLALLR